MLGIWSVLGTPISRFLAFPIGFLLLGVPVGEGLVYPMMNFTADFTVGMLRLTGIPVYRDGTFFSIPSGDWSVVEGCSGVRYLIAAVTLGVLYAYLTYTKTWKRLLFVAVSIAVPIFANGLRAYLIVMIAHLSDMKLAVGIDHLIYGWVFFGIIITILFFIGAFWRDPPDDAAHGQTQAAEPAGGSSGRAFATALAAIAIAGLWPGIVWTLEAGEARDNLQVQLQTPGQSEGWDLLQADAWDWRPRVLGAHGARYDFYAEDPAFPVGLYLGLYLAQAPDAELLSSQNQMVVQKHPVWSDKEQTRRPIRLRGKGLTVKQSRLESTHEQHLLVWSWYRVGDRHTSNLYFGKLLEAYYRLFHQRRDGALIAVATPYDTKLAPAEARLQTFIEAMLPSIERELNRALPAKP
jgi:EpsI family protein